jgi:hypothetical protein
MQPGQLGFIRLPGKFAFILKIVLINFFFGRVFFLFLIFPFFYDVHRLS